MKKILWIFIFLIAGFSSSGRDLISQEEMMAKLLPLLKEAVVYEKFTEIEARQAQAGEVIQTKTSDGLETQNTAQKGDYIVRNLTDAKEQYIIKSDKFELRYKYLNDADGDFKRYQAIGEIKAIVVSDVVLDMLNAKQEFYFMAPWGEKMIAKKDDYLVSPRDYSEIYRIAAKEFFETYRIKK